MVKTIFFTYFVKNIVVKIFISFKNTLKVLLIIFNDSSYKYHVRNKSITSQTQTSKAYFSSGIKDVFTFVSGASTQWLIQNQEKQYKKLTQRIYVHHK